MQHSRVSRGLATIGSSPLGVTLCCVDLAVVIDVLWQTDLSYCAPRMGAVALVPPAQEGFQLLCAWCGTDGGCSL